MSSGIHADRITRACFYAVAAVNTPQGVDLISDRELFNRIVRILARLDINTLGRTSRRAEKAGGALDCPVFLEREPMTSTKCIWIRQPLFWILDGDGRLGIFRQAKHL